MTPTPRYSGIYAAGEAAGPLQHAGDGWLLVGRSGQIQVTDPRAVSELDALAAALAAADRAIATATTCGQSPS